MASTATYFKRYLGPAIRTSLRQQKHICGFHSTGVESNIINRQNLGARQATDSTIKADPRISVFTKSAPDPLPGIYSQAVIANGMVYCSGNVAMDPETNKIIDGDIRAHTVCPPAENLYIATADRIQHQCIKNLSEILNKAGSSINHVVKVNIFLADMADFAKMNEVYLSYWGHVKPCRTCVAVKSLPLDTDIEIECTAVVIE